MQKSTTDEELLRNHLKTRRDQLLKEFWQNPSNTLLAIQIRVIDDEIAELTANLRTKKKAGLNRPPHDLER